MPRLLLLSAVLLLVIAYPARVFAKGETVKITITGFDLTRPIEITDTNVLRRFNIWAGPGTGSSEPNFNPFVPSFIADWSSGAVAKVPEGLKCYQVSFYSKLPTERLAYVVYYSYEPSTQRGYVYIPGKHDVFYRLNTSSIYRGIEGNWFRAWSAWDDVAARLIESSLASAW